MISQNEVLDYEDGTVVVWFNTSDVEQNAGYSNWLMLEWVRAKCSCLHGSVDCVFGEVDESVGIWST